MEMRVEPNPGVRGFPPRRFLNEAWELFAAGLSSFSLYSFSSLIFNINTD